ncbi:MAG: MATE family efflux transporter [Planctomycetota bacterium]
MSHPADSPKPAYEPATPNSRSLAVGLLVLALPIIASMISRTVMSWVDFAMVSSLGPAAQAAIVPASIGLFCLIALGFGITSAVSTLVSQALGRGEHRRCGAYAWQGAWIGVAWGGLTLLLWPFVPGIVGAFGHSPDVAAMEADYITIGLLGIGPAVIAAAWTNFFTGIHQPWAGFWATLIANVFNIFANWVLIYGNLGAPALGVAGAAWATSAAAAVSVLVLFGFMAAPKLRREFGTFHGLLPKPTLLRPLLRIGLPAGLQLVGDIATFAVFLFLLIGRFGTTAMAGSNIAFKFFELAIMPCVGVAFACAAAVGKSIGQADLELARRQAYTAWRINLAWVAAVAIIYVTAGGWLVTLLTDDPEVAAVAWSVLLCMAVFQLFDATQFTFANALRGAGDTLVPAVIMLVGTAGVMLAGGWLVAVYAPGFGVIGPWWMAVAAFALIACLYALRFRSGVWERIDINRDRSPR